MKIKRISFYLLIVIFLFAIYGAIHLSITDFRIEDVCPKIAGIPACYLVLIFFLLGLFAHLFRRVFARTSWYYMFVSIPFLMALNGTVTELSGIVVCPRTSSGIPMCFISLGICTALILLKIVESRNDNKIVIND